MEIFVNILGTNKINIKVQINDTIESVKIKIQELQDIPIEQQRLIFNRKRLENDKQLWYYGIQNGSILGLKPHLRGG